MEDFDKELISLLLLADDPDRIVSETVRHKLAERGEDAIAKIECMDSKRLLDHFDRVFINDLIIELKEKSAKSGLVKLFELPEPPFNKTLFLLTKLADTDAEENIWNASFEHFFVELSMEIAEDKTPIENIEIFNYIFFKRFGFNFRDSQMQDKEYALLDKVLLSRAGNPVSISLIYFLLARISGMPVFPLCVAGGVIPAYEGNNGQVLFYINLLNNGAIFSRENAPRFFSDIGMDMIDSSHLEREDALGAIYLEMLLFVFRNSGLSNRKTGVLESVRYLFGGKRYL